MENYQKIRVKLTNTELNKLKSTTKAKTRTTSNIIKNKYEDEELRNELLLTTR